LFDHDPPAVLAIDPAHLVTKDDDESPKGDEVKGAGFEMIIARVFVAAILTPWL